MNAIMLTINPRDRIELATTIERLINMLDESEPDPDLEPWLGSGDDREGDVSDWEPDFDDEANGDDEPTLGAPERHPHSTESRWGRSGFLTIERSRGQERWADGSPADECEDVSEDEGAITGDEEPGLGWCESAGRGPRPDEGIDGREYDVADDRQYDDSELEDDGLQRGELDQAENDFPGFLWGGNERPRARSAA